jgi:hypothetical protein
MVLLLVFFSPTGTLIQAASAQNYPYGTSPYDQSSSYGRQYSTSQQPYAGQSYSNQGQYSGQYQGQNSNPYTAQGYEQAQQLSQQANQAFTPEQLQEMVAPIALYPDALIGQILAAATYPAQVSAAYQWLRAQGSASAEAIAAGADAQTGWDPSVKALTAFPQVLALMNQNLQWTTDLGNAYYNQPQDVLATIQAMRQRAQNAGTLQSTPQEQVTDNGGYIQLAPPSPQVVYVPIYNPWSAYGAPVSPYPGFSLLGTLESFFSSSVMRYGMGIAMGAFSSTPFGWLGWALDWLGSAILFHHSDYYSHSTTVAHWSSPRGGSFSYRQGNGQYQNDRSREGYSRGINGSNSLSYGRDGIRPQENYGVNRSTDLRSNRPSTADNGRAVNNYYGERGQAQATMPERPQFYSRSGSEGVRQQAWAGRPTSLYDGAQQYRSAPAYSGQRSYSYGQSSFGSGKFSSSSSRSFVGSTPKPEHSQGFHLFGGGRSNKSFGSSYHAPKPPKEPKSYGGGKHAGGGIFGGHHGDKHHR